MRLLNKFIFVGNSLEGRWWSLMGPGLFSFFLYVVHLEYTLLFRVYVTLREFLFSDSGA